MIRCNLYLVNGCIACTYSQGCSTTVESCHTSELSNACMCTCVQLMTYNLRNTMLDNWYEVHKHCDSYRDIVTARSHACSVCHCVLMSAWSCSLQAEIMLYFRFKQTRQAKMQVERQNIECHILCNCKKVLIKCIHSVT